MRVEEYIPFYGLLFRFRYYTGIDGKSMTVNKMFQKYPEFELTDIHLDQFLSFDRASLQRVLKHKYFTPETVVTYLRELFDNYKSSGGDPLEWLHVTFESVYFNPDNYKVELRTTLEKTLIEWIEIYSKEPFVLPVIQENENPFPLIFISAEVYSCFVEYRKHIIDFYKDYSYLKKRLEDLNLIHRTTDNAFMKFLLNDIKFISQKDFDEYSIRHESKLRSLGKSSSEQRINNFNNVFGSLL